MRVRLSNDSWETHPALAGECCKCLGRGPSGLRPARKYVNGAFDVSTGFSTPSPNSKPRTPVHAWKWDKMDSSRLCMMKAAWIGEGRLWVMGLQ